MTAQLLLQRCRREGTLSVPAHHSHPGCPPVTHTLVGHWQVGGCCWHSPGLGMSCARGQTMIRSGEQPKEGKGCWAPGGVQRSGGTWFQLLNYPQAVLSAGIVEAPTDP